MRITVIGAGAIGSAVAHELIEREDVVQVQICDARSRTLQGLHDEVKSPKLRSFQVDVRDINVLEPIIRGSACVIGCAAPEINPFLAEACVGVGSHFCDLGGNDELVRRELGLDEKARKKSIWIVPNCGLAPGLLNILCLHGIEQFDSVEAAHLRVGDVPLHPEPPFNFRISWSAERVLDDYIQPALVIENGKVRSVEALTGDEEIHFPEPFGRMEAFSAASGLTLLAEEIAGKVKQLDYKTVRWPGHASQMRFLLGLGFGENRHIDVRTHLTFRDVLVRKLKERLGGSYDDAVLLRVLLKGKKGGKKKTLVYEMIDRYDSVKKRTAMKRCTSIPTATVAYMIASGRVAGGGASPPEKIVPRDEYCRLIKDQGLNITTTWLDGYSDVAEVSVNE